MIIFFLADIILKAMKLKSTEDSEGMIYEISNIVDFFSPLLKLYLKFFKGRKENDYLYWLEWRGLATSAPHFLSLYARDSYTGDQELHRTFREMGAYNHYKDEVDLKTDYINEITKRMIKQ